MTMEFIFHIMVSRFLVQGPSASAYVTYCINNDALRAIQAVNNIMIDGRLIKTSLGTTKYCSHFMKNQSCPKPDCMYLHDLGDPEASFTKEVRSSLFSVAQRSFANVLLFQPRKCTKASTRNTRSVYMTR